MRSKLQIFWFGVFTLLLVCSSYAQLSMIRNPLTNAGAGDGGDLPLGSVVSMIDPMTVEGCATDGLPVGVVTTVESRTAAPDLYVVASSGIARVTIAGGSSAITPGDNVVPASTGFIQNISDNPAGFVVGIALESGTAGSTIRIMINVHTGGGGASMNNDTLVQLTSPGDFVVVAGEDDIHGALVDLDAAIGNRTYTENNYVTDGETVTSSLDALDQAMLLASTIEGDVVAGDGLNGGADDVLPGADADVTLTVDAGTGLEINGGTGALQVDQDDIPYTATTGTDWIDPDPTYVNTALDQTAERITLLESGSGTVTSIAGGNGIDPDGPSEGDVTLNLDVATTGALSTTAGDGDQLAVNTDGFIAVNATNQLEIDGTAAGNGLIGGDGSALAVGDGDGLTVNADDIDVNVANGVEIVSDNVQVDEDAIPYTPTTLTDWTGDADPGMVNNALDQLAQRIESGTGAVLEDGNGVADFTYDGSTAATVAVQAGTGITSDDTGVHVNYGTTAGTAVEGNQTATITAGNGLTGDLTADALGDGFSTSLAVGDGAGVTVNADDIEVNTADGVTIDGDNVVIDETWFGNDVTVSATGDVTINDDAVQDSDVDWGDGADQIDADNVPYDNTASGLTATEVEGAIDEMDGRIDGLEATTVSLQDAYDVSGDIVVDPSTPVTITSSGAGNRALDVTAGAETAILVVNDGADPAIQARNDGSGPAIYSNGDLRFTGAAGTKIYSNSDINVMPDENDDATVNAFNVLEPTGGTAVFIADENGDITTVGDYHVGTIGYSDNGTDAATAGASLVGTFDEFDNSDAGNVQDVLDDLDGAISTASTVQGDIVSGDGLAGGVDDVLPGPDADVTLSINVANGVEIVSDNVQIDEDAIPYTPTTLTDWTGDADPGMVNNALDDLAGRVDGLESTDISLQDAYDVGNTISITGDAIDVDATTSTAMTLDNAAATFPTLSVTNTAPGTHNSDRALELQNDGDDPTLYVSNDGDGPAIQVTDDIMMNNGTRLASNVDVNVQVDQDNTGDNEFNVRNGTDATVFSVDENGDVVADGDYHVGTIGLSDNGTDAATAGASLVGTFDEFDNSDATNVQDVLDDLDGAISTAGTVQGDLVAGTGLTGGADDVLPGTDADYTINIDNTYFSNDATVDAAGAVTISDDAVQDSDIDWGTGADQVDADNVPYDNTTSGMTATEVEGAIDEIDGRIDGLETGTGATLDNGNGIAAFSYDGSADASVAVAGGTGITVDGTGVNVDYGTSAGTAVEGNQTATINAGNGLTGDLTADALGDGFTATLAIGDGDGITVNADDIDVNVANGVEIVGDNVQIDEDEIPYTPSTATDWTGDVDPGNVDDALDQIAGRIDGLSSSLETGTTNGNTLRWNSTSGAWEENNVISNDETDVAITTPGTFDINATGAASVTANSGLDIDVTGVATLDASTSVGIRGANGASFRSTSGPAILQAEGGPANLRGNTNVTVEATTLQTHVAAGTNVNISAGTAGATGDITLNAPLGDVNVTNADVYVDGANDYHIGTVGLTDTGAGAGTSGAFLVGTYDEFDNSDATNVQDVLDDLDGAISSAGTVQGDLVAGTGLTGGADNILPGADADYTVNIDNTYFSNDATVDAAGAVTISDDAVQDSDIDWGTGADQIDADNVPYDNTTSGMTATEVEGAIDEIDGRIDGLETGTGATLDNGNGIVAFSYDGSTDASVEVAGGTGITVDGTGVNVDYGSTAGTAVEGNTSVSIVAGTGMSGGGAVTLGSGGTVTLNNDGVTSVNGSSGDVTLANLTQGTGINAFTYNGSAATTVGLSNTGVTAATYGDATHVSQVTVDAQGRITGATDVEITGASPTGAALTSGNIWVGNASNTAVAVAMSGDATLAAGGGITLANSGVTAGTYGDATNVAQVTVDAKGRVTSATEVAINPDDADADPVNEAQTLAGSGTTDITLSDVSGSGGGTVTFAGTGATSVSRTGNTITINSSDDSGSDDQTLTYNAATDEITIEDGNTIDISEVNTDNQNISGSSFDAGTANLTIGIEDGTSEVVSLIDLADNQNITGSSFDAGTANLTIGIEDGASQVVSLIDLVDDQNISGSSFNSTTNVLTIGIEDGTSETVDLSALDNAGSDDQTLTLAGTNLTIEDGNTVTFTNWDTDNTDDITTSTAAGGDLTGTYPNPTLDNGVVASAEIADATEFVSVQNSAGTPQFGVTDGNRELRFNGSGGIGINFNATTHQVTVDGSGVVSGQWTDAGDYLTPSDGGGIRMYESGANAGKIDAQKIDPVVQIDGKQYATWVVDGIGLRTDVVGQAQLENGVYKVDLADQPEASDLWLFYHVVAENSIVPFVTPQGRAYLIARLEGSVLYVEALEGDPNAKFSYRLSGKRIDEAAKSSEEINTRRPEDHTNIYLDVEAYDKNGNPINK